MFIGKLYDFQENHEQNLLKSCANHEQMVLQAPTGSGKTVLASKFIDDYLDENPKTVFLWFCPGAGGLETQSQSVFEEQTSGVDIGDIYDFIRESDPSEKVYFVNWEKINRESNLVLREGEYRDFMLQIEYCRRNNIEIFVIIDEEHKYRRTADEYIANILPKHVLRISATPVTGATYTETITDSEVKDAGLIADSISINQGVSKAMEEKNSDSDDLVLIQLADKLRKEIDNEYKKLGINVRPLVLIQFPNGTDDWIGRIKEALADLGYGENSGMVASWFSGEHPDNPEELKKLDGQYSFLLFKQAIATGWDCPRAKILVKLREGGTETFNIQTIGRIRRMPEKCHYDNELLDRCYVFTLDPKFKDGLTEALTDSFYTYKYDAKPNKPTIVFETKFLEGSDRFAVNEKSVVEVVRAKFLEKCDKNNDGIITRKELEDTLGFVFGDVLTIPTIEGVVKTMSREEIENIEKRFVGEHKISLKYDGFIIRDAKRKIASAMGIDESISSKALRYLFDAQDKIFQISLEGQEDYEFEKNNKIIDDMSHTEYSAFLVNNKDKLIEVLQEINGEDIVELEEVDAKNVTWSIPNTQYYKKHRQKPDTKYLKKNVFEDYGNSILLPPNRSAGEIEFEKWCELKDCVDWVYKNGDKGEEFFSIIYRKAFRRNNFYPDYIIGLKNGETWFVEVKGGQDADGKTENIDNYSKNKMQALKEYVENLHDSKVHFGFVRRLGSDLYISTTEWDENLFNSDVWKPIEDYIK